MNYSIICKVWAIPQKWKTLHRQLTSFLVSRCPTNKIPFIENNKSLWVSWLFSFLASSFHYQTSFSCFLEDIDPASNIFKNFLDGSSSFSVPALCERFQNLRFLQFWDLYKQYFFKCPINFLRCSTVFWYV